MFMYGMTFACSAYLLIVVSFGELRIGSYEVSENGIVRFVLMFVLSVIVILSCVSAYTDKKLIEHDRELEISQQNIRYNDLRKKVIESEKEKQEFENATGYKLDDFINGELKIIEVE